MRLKEFLNEKLNKQSIGYSSKDTVIHDNNPYILILDYNYPPGKGDGILAFNLHYLEDMSVKQRNKFIRKINAIDDTVISPKDFIPKVKKVLSDFIHKNKDSNYPTNKSIKIKRYKELMEKFPELKNTIRHYKKNKINWKNK